MKTIIFIYLLITLIRDIMLLNEFKNDDELHNEIYDYMRGRIPDNLMSVTYSVAMVMYALTWPKDIFNWIKDLIFRVKLNILINNGEFEKADKIMEKELKKGKDLSK